MTRSDARALAPAVTTTPALLRPLPRVAPRFDGWTAAAQAWHLLGFEARGVMRSLPFLVMLLLALANFIANRSIDGMRFDSAPYPLTRLMLADLAGSINAVLVLVMLFYSGELVHRDRQLKIDGVTNATPLPAWAQRARQAHANAIENLAVFAPLVLVAHAVGAGSPATVFAAQLYLGARLVHYVVYAAGIPGVRTLAFLCGSAATLVFAWVLLARV